MATRIAALLPAHTYYVEPFCGSLAVLLAKPPSHQEAVNDLDENIMTFWRVLRDRPDELIRACALTPHSRAEYAACRQPAGDVGDVERARRWWVRITQSRGKTPSNAGWWHHAAPDLQSAPRRLAHYVDRMAPVAERLMRVSLECMPALDMVGKYGGHPGNLLYVDPPYLGSTRAERGRYVHEMKGEPGHRELGEALNSCRAAVVLSGYNSPLYAELYGGWDRLEISTETGNAKGDRSRVEVLWSNRSFARQAGLFDVS